MKLRTVVPCGLLMCALAVSGCQLNRPAPSPTADIDPALIEAEMWAGDWDAARSIADEHGWVARGSIEGERLRQSLLLRLGQRAELLKEVHDWRKADPADPSLAYLEARLLQQPERQYARFRQLQSIHPQHAWIRLGAAGLAQSRGLWREARRQLDRAPAWDDAAEFRTILEARQAGYEGRLEDALAMLEELAFVADRQSALLEVQTLASNAPPVIADRARAHRELLMVQPDASPRLRMRAVARRALAEHRYNVGLSLDELLPQLDAWSARLGLPTGWVEHPRYTMPLVGGLLRPELDSGGPVAAWHAAGCKLILGQSVLRGTEVLYLEDTTVIDLEWPGFEKPIEIVLAEAGETTNPTRVVGGAIFRGFYIRRDLANVVARAARLSAEGYEGPLDAPRGFRSPKDSYLPEDLDLPLRIRAERVDEDFERLELIAVLIHEAGHLPEVRRTLPKGPSLGQMIGLAYFTLWSGDPMAGFEMRAQARALAASPDPHWVLADIVEQARESSGTYAVAYRWLLEDLVGIARDAGHPELATWNRLPAEALRAMGAEVCRRRHFGLLDMESVNALRAAADAWIGER